MKKAELQVEQGAALHLSLSTHAIKTIKIKYITPASYWHGNSTRWNTFFMFVAEREIMSFEKEKECQKKKMLSRGCAAFEKCGLLGPFSWVWFLLLFPVSSLWWDLLLNEGRDFFKLLSCIICSELCFELLWKVIVGQWNEAFLGIPKRKLQTSCFQMKPIISVSTFLEILI